MNIIRLKRNKINTVLSTYDEYLKTPIDVQKESVLNFAKNSARVIVCGPTRPNYTANGFRWLTTGAKPAITNLIGTYLQSIPGAEICVLTNPDVLLDEEGLKRLLESVDGKRMDMAWGCHINLGSKPRVFVFSAPVLAHVMGDLPQLTTFHDDWQSWMHNWGLRLLRERYFDASKFGAAPLAVREEVPPVSVSEQAQAEDRPKKRRNVVRKVKIATP